MAEGESDPGTSECRSRAAGRRKISWNTSVTTALAIDAARRAPAAAWRAVLRPSADCRSRSKKKMKPATKAAGGQPERQAVADQHHANTRAWREHQRHACRGARQRARRRCTAPAAARPRCERAQRQHDARAGRSPRPAGRAPGPAPSYWLMCWFSSRSMRQEPMATAPPNAHPDAAPRRGRRAATARCPARIRCSWLRIAQRASGLGDAHRVGRDLGLAGGVQQPGVGLDRRHGGGLRGVAGDRREQRAAAARRSP